jgi:3-deoxy-D-manno-octulosonic-acid transferase
MRLLEDYALNHPDTPHVWLHAASVGELDQALGLLREIKKRRPDQRVIVSVFSSSVKRLDHPEIDFMFRLPLDFFPIWPGIIKRIRPIFFATMTWDVYPNLLYQLHRGGVPSFLCSGAIDPGSTKLRFPWRSLFKTAYALFSGIGAADEESARIFRNLAGVHTGIKITGDSRYDTILHKLSTASLRDEDRSRLDRIVRPTLLLASTYDADDRALFPYMEHLLDENPTWSVLIFPHHVEEERIAELIKNLKAEGLGYSLFSDNEPKERIVIVDRLGILALAYRSGDLCYVGGGVHHRIHNTAEPAATGLAVVTGPRIDSSPAATALEREGALFRCEPEAIAQRLVSMMGSETERRAVGEKGKICVRSRAGASARFYDEFLGEILI